MSEQIKHECGIAMIRLRKPLQHYVDEYKTHRYAVEKLQVMMQKQSNRGQDGVGVANIKIGARPGIRYISRYRVVEPPKPIKDLFGKIDKKFKKAEERFEKIKEEKKKKGEDFEVNKVNWFKENAAFSGELWLGHLRYGTHSENGIESCHPFLRKNNWRSRNLVMAGNFNMTNVDELFELLLSLGQHPKEKTDTVTVMEKIGHFLDEENQRIFDKYKGQLDNRKITERIEEELDLQDVLKHSFKKFDGGYAMVGLIGHGTAFVVRDPNGIRPAYQYIDEEVVVVASERQAIKAAFNVNYDDIKPIAPGNALIVHKNGACEEVPILEKSELKACLFERIYFSQGTDPDIYRERKDMGRLLIPQILKAINYDLKNTVFSYIPQTAESSFLGVIQGLNEYLLNLRKEVIIDGKTQMYSREDILQLQPRVEKLVIKGEKLRTFIEEGKSRNETVKNSYDTTHGVTKKTDTLVVIDDSIVRGTTLEESVLMILDKLKPKKIVIVSSAPQIRYPDCYGIDMSKIKKFVAFRAMKALIKERSLEYQWEETYHKAKENIGSKDQANYLKELYEQFTDDEISQKIAEIIRPEGMKAELEIVYQTIDNLHKACPHNRGDWYFTGNYPTPGGNRVVNKAFINVMEGNDETRSY